MPTKGFESITVHGAIYNGLIFESEKQHRSVASLTEAILLKNGIKELSDQELQKRMKKLEVLA
jgi:hypothetical protein